MHKTTKTASRPAELRDLITRHVEIGPLSGLGPTAYGRGWTFRVPAHEVNATIRVLESVVPAGVDVEGQGGGRVFLFDHRTNA